MKNAALTVLGIIGIWILMILFTSCGSINPAISYQKNIAKEREYPFWLKNQKFKNKDWRIQVAENQLEAYELRKKREAEQEEIKRQVEAIKSQIGNE